MTRDIASASMLLLIGSAALADGLTIADALDVGLQSWTVEFMERRWP